MTDEGLIFNSLKNSNCDGYLLFSYLVKGGVSRGYANVSLTKYLKQNLFVRLMRGLFITPIFTQKDIKRIKDGFKEIALDSDVALLFVYVDKENFIKHYDFYRFEPLGA